MKPLSLTLVLAACGFLSFGQNPLPEIDSAYLSKHYEKQEYRIAMRDGTKLFTLVYAPRDKSREYPILLNRTCYNASAFASRPFHPHFSFFIREGYIIALQDVRGRYLSEGTFDNMRPNIPGNDPSDKTAIDESSDTWDTIEWMIHHIEGNNGRVGMFGISYPGFYTSAALPDAHPALKASSPQAPIADFFFDDFHHNGAYLQSYTAAFAVFGYQHDEPTPDHWFLDELNRFMDLKVGDAYAFHLAAGPLKTFTEKFHHDNFFWKQIVDHPNYDAFWQKRSILPHLKEVTHAVMTVGGWFDAEDLYGPLNTYKTIEQTSPEARNTLVMGPWGHGDWSVERGKSIHNHIYFGDSISTYFLREVEAPFFAYHLKGEGTGDFPEALMFDTGRKEWKRFSAWPPADAPRYTLHFGPGGRLSINNPFAGNAVFEYVSDPSKPVPYTSEIEGITFTPRRFMSDDQRHASRRPDVLTFQTDVLGEDITIAGEIVARLKVSMTGTDADFVVKLIDVYPQDHPDYAHNPDNVEMGGYQQLVRHEVFRGRFRNSFEKPEPFKPNVVSDVTFPLQDVLHTFKKGHRVMIQIHSTWFPYIDRNPQKYVDNIYKAEANDFVTSTIRVLGESVVEAGGNGEMKATIDRRN